MKYKAQKMYANDSSYHVFLRSKLLSRFHQSRNQSFKNVGYYLTFNATTASTTKASSKISCIASLRYNIW